jgi:hypothetical protein
MRGVGGSAWDEVRRAVAAAPYPVDVLPVAPDNVHRCLATLEITTRSWLGAVVAHTGGLLIDHGWLRVLGAGHDALPDILAAAQPASAWLTVGYDVLGGQFAWIPAAPDAAPTVHYYGPDTLDWQDLELGYADWLHAMLTGATTRFYETLRWPGWVEEVAALDLGQGIHAFPPPWSVEGDDLSAVSRRAVPFTELVSLHRDTGNQLGG